ncbi:hypothetical protein LEP1GSC061_3299 [Leptospira wolffii serovar Khorat str. Khorat-H2]|nr:hypothetical protein LEP1GSC061_3299 [Leptospira wolffii serovar Khorat str. Khorat-H2]
MGSGKSGARALGFRNRCIYGKLIHFANVKGKSLRSGIDFCPSYPHNPIEICGFEKGLCRVPLPFF